MTRSQERTKADTSPAEWQRLTNNLYVVDGRIQKAREEIERLENDRGQILLALDAFYKAERQA